MNPDLVLGVMSALVGFVLKTALGFGVCLGLSWLVKSPARRFLVWSGFLYGTAAYWVWMAKSVLATKQVVATTVLAPTTHSVAQPAMSGFDALPIPGSWAFPLGMALRVIGIAYLLVSTYLLVMQIKKHLQLKWVLGFTSQPPKEIGAGFQMLAENAGVGRSRLLVLSGVSSPATCGFVRPTILLPDACLEQDHSDLEVILRHELHHVRRWDFLWNNLAIACRAILFFHPACWYAVKRMQFDRELACDVAAVSDSPKRQSEVRRVPDPLCAVEFLARFQELGNRLRGIFGTSASSCSFHPGWKQEIAGLVGWVTDRLWTRSSCGVRQHRALFGSTAFLCSAANSAAIGG